MMIRCEILYRQEDLPRVDIIRMLDELMKASIRIGWPSTSRRLELRRCSEVTNAASKVASLSWVDLRNPEQESSVMGAVVLLVLSLYNPNLSGVVSAPSNMLYLTESVVFVSHGNKAGKRGREGGGGRA